MRYLPWIVSVVVLCGLPALAAEGRKPIHSSTTITEPGSYIVTRDINVTSGSAIVVNADSVRVDLNGFTLTGGATADVIFIASVRNIAIENGDVHLLPGTTHDAVRGDAVTSLRLSKVSVAAEGEGGIQLGGSGIEMSSCRRISVPGAGDLKGIRISGSAARILNNESTMNSEGSAFDLSVSFSEIRGNVGFGGNATQATLSVGGAHNIIAENRINAGEGNAISVSGFDQVVLNNVATEANEGGVGMSVTADYSRLEGNIATQNNSGGIRVQGSGNLVLDNIASGSALGAGISVSGNGNLIDRNTCRSTPVGLSLTGAQNVFRNNILRGNTTAVTDTGAGNTDAGGNVN